MAKNGLKSCSGVSLWRVLWVFLYSCHLECLYVSWNSEATLSPSRETHKGTRCGLWIARSSLRPSHLHWRSLRLLRVTHITHLDSESNHNRCRIGKKMINFTLDIDWELHTYVEWFIYGARWAASGCTKDGRICVLPQAQVKRTKKGDQRKKSYYEPIYNKYVGGYIYNALSGQVSRYIVKSLKSSIWMFL